MGGGQHLLDTCDDVQRGRHQRVGHLVAQRRELGPRPHRPRRQLRPSRHRRSPRSTRASEPSGLVPRTRRVRGSSARSTALTGDGTDSRSSRRVPGPIAASCSACVANTRRSTAAPASTSAGKPRTVPRSTLRGSSSMSSGHVRSPLRSSSPATASGDGLPGPSRELLLQRVEVLAAGHLVAVGRFDGERHPQVGRQLVEVESVDRHQDAAAPPQLSLQALQQRFAVGVEVNRAPRGRCPGPGTKLRRNSFGSERISAVTSSSRKAGTCQANSSPPRRASTSTGTCTVTPSSTAPGSKR